MSADRLQFSIRSMLLATAIVAFITAEAVVFPNWIAGLAGVFGTIMAAALATMMVIHGRPSERTLAVGTLFPLGWILLADRSSTSFAHFYGLHSGFVSHWNQIGMQNRHAYVLAWLFAIAVGAACLVFRWLVEWGQTSCTRSSEHAAEHLDQPLGED